MARPFKLQNGFLFPSSPFIRPCEGYWRSNRSMDVAARKALIFSSNCAYAASAITWYDYFITFPREVRSLWQRKFNVVTLLFILERYAALTLFTLRWISSYTITADSCRLTQIALKIVSFLVTFGIGLFTSFRAYAITGRMTLLVLAVTLCGMFSPAANIYNFARPSTLVYNREQLVCVMNPTAEAIQRTPKTSAPLPMLVRSITIFGDILVLVITWNKSYSIYRDSRRIKGFKPKVAVMLLRDGTLYFLTLALLNIAVLLQVTFGVLLNKNGASSFIFVSEAVASTLICRFILNLRDIAGDTKAADGTTGDSTTLNFATPSLLGNLAAPLHTSLLARTNSEDSDSDRGYRMAREPFMVDLETDHDVENKDVMAPE
ncbi:hypothetical protein BXZ70DRAFT_1005879 [Cristinia sonorae]|uniref:DUF6533 domain-containing protein n=1 Tax=Cristinia sonorae TaxID=1940300 RepID=A0A8K0UU86_9AGAR|nr:hypothetical protein BXZ70DRAFT_1005879 [Cristinia sonorae]